MIICCQQKVSLYSTWLSLILAMNFHDCWKSSVAMLQSPVFIIFASLHSHCSRIHYCSWQRWHCLTWSQDAAIHWCILGHLRVCGRTPTLVVSSERFYRASFKSTLDSDHLFLTGSAWALPRILLPPTIVAGFCSNRACAADIAVRKLTSARTRTLFAN